MTTEPVPFTAYNCPEHATTHYRAGAHAEAIEADRQAREASAAQSEWALRPSSNVPECTCDREDDSWVGEPVDMPLCPYHEKRLRHLSWESLACMVIDYEAALADKPPVPPSKGA